MKRIQTAWQALAILLTSLAVASCQQSEQETQAQAAAARTFTSQPVWTLAEIDDLADQPTLIRKDLSEAFCIHVYKLPAKADFTEELSYLCQSQVPTPLFSDLDRLASLVGDQPRSVQLSMEQQGEYTEGVFATIYRLPIAPKWVKSAEIPEFMTLPSHFDYVILDGKVEEDLSSQVGGDLQFDKARLYYHTTVSTPDGQSFTNERSTEINSFQVQGGNPDIGIGMEALVASPEEHYQVYNTITVTIGDTLGGSALLTLIRINVRNYGFPELTEQVMSDIATAQATHVHDQLLVNLENRKLGLLPRDTD